MFDEFSTADEVLAGVSLSGQRILITGASAGLGVETARALAAHGAQVVGAVRDLEKGARAMGRVWEGAHNGGGVELIELDLADLTSVRACADGLMRDGRKFDVVIANAGVMAPPFGHTAQGFETQFGTNHLGHFVLVNRIAGLIRDGGRLVNLSSAGHRYSDVDLDDASFERTPYEPWQAYGRSKTANVLFAVAFDRRHKARGVRATAVHPGGIMTELSRYFAEGEMEQRIAELSAAEVAAGRPPFRLKSIPQGAATSVWAGFVADGEAVGGRYCEDCHVAPVATDAVGRGDVQPYALDPERAEALWALSEAMVGERF